MAATRNDEQLAYSAGRLYWSGGSAPAAIGRGGVTANKKEGDGATPAGVYPLLFGLYRSDRVALPASRLPITPMAPNQGWVDDPADPNYNRPVWLPYPARAERMWREDHVYDVVVIIGYNMNPVVAGAGSAIFLHIARPTFSPTEGCIAISKDILLRIIPLLGPESAIAIRE
ncbi:MAG: L,D-transpeptidase family protein [Alphaproteobacteria bacterium]|nr:L,D-transpeptidase family protein [Alphaproteobacteria bacterium]